ncbi:MAG: glycosyltransferase family 2 protein [Burkholderiales bacterium]|nr:glycosyltransferase family 2 protein [Burkholderiales bacterium]
MPRLTVLICTHDRAGLLARTLDSLRAAARPTSWQVDILVAANACTDGTHALLEGWAAAPSGGLPLAWFAEPKPGKSNALNSAIPRIGSDLVAFVDDDHRVHARYLAAICEAADAYPNADLFCGRILPDWDGSEPPWVHDDGPYRIYPLPVPRFDKGDEPLELDATRGIPGGGNLFLRSGWLRRVGPFATDLGPSGHDLGGSEDLDWVLRALQLGARLQYVPDVVQYHFVDAERLELGYLLRKAYKRTASTVRVDAAMSPTSGRRVPRYVFRKLAVYAFKAATALGMARRRFYLVRTAAALGEVAGHLARPGRSDPDRPAPSPDR